MTVKSTLRPKIIAGAIVFAVLVGCSTPRYIISTTDGTMIQANGEPKLNQNTGMYQYRDLNGHDAVIKQTEVKQIIPR